MRLILALALVIVVAVGLAEGGIYRRYVRRHRARPDLHHRVGRREFQSYKPSRPWTSFFVRRPRSPWMFQPPRMGRRFRFQNERMDQRVPHFHHQQAPRQNLHYSAGPTAAAAAPRIPLRWRPLDYGNPIARDPTFDYAPPTMDRVKLIPESRNRRTQMGAPPQGYNPHGRPPPPPPPPSTYRPGPSLWKMLAHKQRPKRPYPPPQNHHQHPQQRHPVRFHGQSVDSPLYHHQVFGGQAEIFPRIPNIVYFKPTDVVSRRPTVNIPGRPTTMPTKSGGAKLVGSVSEASLYSSEVASQSELRPVAVVKPTVGGSKEYIFTVVGYKGPNPTTPIPPPVKAQSPSTPATTTTTTSTTTTTTTKRPPTILHAVKTTPVTISSTHNSAVKPFEPTESLGTSKDLLKNHRDEEDEEDDESVEESSIVEDVKGTSGSSVVDGILEYLNIVPPAPVFPVRSNSFNVDSGKAEDEEDESEEKVESPRRPVFNPKTDSFQTSTSVSVSVSNDKVRTKSPVTSPPKVRSTTRRVAEAPKTTTTPVPSTTTPIATTTTQASTTEEVPSTTTSKATKFPELPVFPRYTKSKSPVYAKRFNSKSKNNLGHKNLGKYTSASSSSALSKEMNGSGEIVVITGGRSKVKEYKPQFIADNSKLLSFDKVAESSSTAPSVESTTPSPSSTTTKSPLQEFDPMQLLHSWLTKSSD